MAWQYALAAAQFLSGVSAQKKQEKQQIEALKKTAKGLVQQMNWSFQNYEMARQTAFAAAVTDMTKVRMQAARQYGSVSAAVNEDFAGGGRTADLLKRSVKNNEARAAASIRDNWEAKNNEINLNKISTMVSTKNAIASLPSVTRKSGLSYLLDGVKAYYGVKASLDDGKIKTDTPMLTEKEQNFFDAEGIFATNPAAGYIDYVNSSGSPLFDYTGDSVVPNLLVGGDMPWGRKHLLL